MTQDRRRSRLQAVLVASDLAIAVVLVTGAMLLGRSLSRLRDVPLGFDVERVVTFDVRLPTATYPDSASWRTYMRRATESLAAIPGVTRVGATTLLPLAEGLAVGYHVRSETQPETETQTPVHYVVSGDYFAAMGIPVIEGRAFGEARDAGPMVMLSRTLARTAFPEGGSVGRKVVLHKDGEGTPATVVGVVEDIRRHPHGRNAAGDLDRPRRDVHTSASRGEDGSERVASHGMTGGAMSARERPAGRRGSGRG